MVVKRIHFSHHARRRMDLRGATEAEVIESIQNGNLLYKGNGKFERKLILENHLLLTSKFMSSKQFMQFSQKKKMLLLL